MAHVLVVDDEAGIREFISGALELEGHEVHCAGDGQEALRLADERCFDLVFTDLKMPKLGGLELLSSLKKAQPEIEVVVLTAHGTIDTAVEAMKLGAFDYLQKPIGSLDELGVIADRALERRRLKNLQSIDERTRLDRPRLGYGDPAMTAVEDAIDKVAPTHATVLLLGESGTGKEVAAQAIHEYSDRKDKPFVAINCAALTSTLLESELFGHEKGAFTGASERRRGRIELANGGTFFLDEIAELRPEHQAKLLRVLQERTFSRVGGTQNIDVDVRWIAATNRDLGVMIAEGSFREDLYHRIAVFPIALPPLRDRVGDIAPMAELLLAQVCIDLKRPPATISEPAMGELLSWHWPGNVRELRNVLERAAILAKDTILTDHLWLAASSKKSEAAPQTLADVERDAIARALATVEGNRRKAAEVLGIAERTLYDKIKRYQLG